MRVPYSTIWQRRLFVRHLAAVAPIIMLVGRSEAAVCRTIALSAFRLADDAIDLIREAIALIDRGATTFTPASRKISRLDKSAGHATQARSRGTPRDSSRVRLRQRHLAYVLLTLALCRCNLLYG
jgi:hypothetical protein